MPRLSLSLLGPLVVTRDGQTGAFATAKTRALLAYLAIESDRPHARAVLAGLLWPDQPDRAALKNLRNTLARLRAALDDRAQPPFLLVTAQTLQFNPASDHWLDVADFQQQIADCRLQIAICNLQSAIELYRGPFLAGLAVDSAAFEEWALLKREQLDQQAQTALRLLATLLEQQGDYEAARPYVRRLLELSPWDEAAHRQLMRLLALGEQRSAALAQYETCRRLLAQELGVEPEPETTALYACIRDGRLSSGAAEALAPLFRTPAPLHPSPSALFVGRERELARLDEHLQSALAGRSRVVLVTGEAGSGKTALLHEFTRRVMAAHADLVVAAGYCNALTGLGDPYLPFRDILRMLTGDVEAQRASGALSPEHAGRLWTLLPTVAQAIVRDGPDLIGPLAPGADLLARAQALTLGRADAGATWLARLETLVRRKSLPSASQTVPSQTNLFEQMTGVLQALARQHPLVLVLDDLQWADGGSLDLLFHLGRRIAAAGSRILVIGAYRPDDVAQGRQGDRHPLAPIIHEFQRTWGDIPVDLDQAASRAFVDAFLDTEPNALGESFRAQLDRVTGGHALFTVELVREMQERGDLVKDEAGRWVAGPALDWDRLPARVEAVIAGRVDQLATEWQALLAAASVEGEVFTAEAAARVLGLTEAEVVWRLSGALSQPQRLVAAHSLERLGPDGQRLSRYRFRHVLFQRYLYGRLDAVARAHLHEAVGAALEALHTEHPDELAALAPQLAWHFEAAGLVDKAVGYLLLAGQRAYRLSASQEALALYRRGLALLETRPESDERARCELDLQLALSVALQDVRVWSAPERFVALRRAYQLAHQLGEPARLLPALRDWFDVNRTLGQNEQARAVAQQLLRLAEQTAEPTYLIWGHRAMGLACSSWGNLAAARTHLEHALALYRRQPLAAPGLASGGEPDVGVSTLAWLPQVVWLLGYPDQALAHSQQALALAQALDLAPSLALALTTAGALCHIPRREVAAVREYTAQLHILVREKNLSAFQPWVTFFQGWLLTCGNQAQATEGITQMRASIATMQAFRPYQLTVLARACLEAGQVGMGSQALDEALALVDQTHARSSEAEMHRLRGELLLKAEGRRMKDEAEDCFQRAIAVAQRQEARSWELRATMSLARLWHAQGAQGRTEEARARLADVYGWFTEGLDTPDLVEARSLLETLALDQR